MKTLPLKLNLTFFFRDYGVMVELLPDTPNVLLHVSEMEHRRVSHFYTVNLETIFSFK